MFGKLYSIVKESVSNDLLRGLNLQPDSHESIINEASGTIIDVLKSQIESGKIADLLSVFRVHHIEDNSLVRSMISKYAIRLNKNYGILIGDAKKMAEEVMPLIIRKLVSTSKESDQEVNGRNGIYDLFNSLSGYTINFETLLNKMPNTQSA